MEDRRKGGIFDERQPLTRCKGLRPSGATQEYTQGKELSHRKLTEKRSEEMIDKLLVMSQKARRSTQGMQRERRVVLPAVSQSRRRAARKIKKG